MSNEELDDMVSDEENYETKEELGLIDKGKGKGVLKAQTTSDKDKEMVSMESDSEQLIEHREKIVKVRSSFARYEYDSDFLLSLLDSKEEGGMKFDDFHNGDMVHPKLKLGMMFASLEEFRKAVREANILDGYDLKFVRNTRQKINIVCARKDKSNCKYRV